MHRLQIRNAGSVHLGRSNPGACQQDHVYFRPTLEHRMETKCTSTKARLPSLSFSAEPRRTASESDRKLGVNRRACFRRSEDGGGGGGEAG